MTEISLPYPASPPHAFAGTTAPKLRRGSALQIRCPDKAHYSAWSTWHETWRITLAATATVTATASLPSRPRRTSQPRDEGGSPWSKRDGGGGVEFAGVQVSGSLAQWLLAQQAAAGGVELRPTPIQEQAIPRILQGESVVMQSPTGTGKTLAFLLPLLQRLQARQPQRSGSQLRMLILVPNPDLQVQMCALIRGMVGPRRADSVTFLRRDVDNSVPRGAVLVATPKHIVELLEDRATHRAWRAAMEQLEVVVVDEADRIMSWSKAQKKRIPIEERDSEVLREPCARLLRAIAAFKQRGMGLNPEANNWQLVAATATLNRGTSRALAHSAVMKVTRIRASVGAPAVQGKDSDGNASDSQTLFPAGLRHSMMAVYGDYRRSSVLERVKEVVLNQGHLRTLLVIGRRGKIDAAEFGQYAVMGMLKHNLEEYGIAVRTCSQAVESACLAWLEDGQPAQTARPEVIVGDSNVIRGIDLQGIDSVIILGDLKSLNEYIHCAGRTCRLKMGLSVDQTSGHVVSIVPGDVAARMQMWAKLAGFSFNLMSDEEQGREPVFKRRALDADDALMQAAWKEGLPPEEAALAMEELEAKQHGNDVASASDADNKEEVDAASDISFAVDSGGDEDLSAAARGGWG